MINPQDSIKIYNIAMEACNEATAPLSNWFDWFTLIASIVTIICFIITIVQIKKVKGTSKQVADAVKANSTKIKSSLSLITITDALRLSDLVINLTQNGLYQQASMRLHDLNNAAIEISTIHTSLREYQLKIPSEIEHLNDLSTNQQSLYRDSYILSTLQKVNDELKRIESQTKINIINA